MNRLLSALVALGAIMNGVWMIGSPDTWYPSIPGVSETGPYNPHFVRDIGCAFFVAGLGFGWLAIGKRKHAWPAASAGAFFLMMHALVHLWDLVAGREHAQRAYDDLPSIFLPSILAWMLVWLTGRTRLPRKHPSSSSLRARERVGWFARLVAPRFDSFERDFGYDTSYLRFVASVSPSAFIRFALFTVFADQHENVPNNAWFCAKLVAAKREDCGPCTQVVVRMAEVAEPPVPAAVLSAVLRSDERAMGEDAGLAFRFANAVLDRNLGLANELRSQVIARWGERGLVTLSFAIASARVYPTAKYALGYGMACSRIEVGGELLTVK